MDLARFKGLDIVLVCGLPACGKSTFARESFADSAHRRVNRKEIRRFLHEMTRYGDPWSESHFAEHDEALVKHVERKILEHVLHAGEKVLVDNTSVTVESRALYVHLARETHKRAGAIFLNRPVLTCMERNRKRQDPVPENVISNLFASIELPTRAEGFVETLVIS
jgi:predicted kinase